MISDTLDQRQIVRPKPTDVKISVVVPFYNMERYIEDSIQALLAQNYPPAFYEVIMIDNNSTDGSAAIVGKYPAIRLLSERKQGAYAARNTGAAASSGKIIAFTDPDCVPSRDWLERIDSAMERPGVRIVVGSHASARDSFLLRVLEDYEHEKNDYIFSSPIKSVYYGYTNNMAVRKTVFDEIGPFVEMRRGSDVVFVRRCVDRHSCGSVYYSRAVRVRHLEIDSPIRYFQKVFIYGNSIRKYGRMADARPITSRERFLVFRRTVRNHNYSWTRASLLFVMLTVGFLYWICGAASTRLGSGRAIAC